MDRDLQIIIDGHVQCRGQVVAVALPMLSSIVYFCQGCKKVFDADGREVLVEMRRL